MLLGPVTGAPAVLRTRSTGSMPVLDRYRADGATANGDPYDPRLFREEVYLPLMSKVAAAVAGDRSAPAQVAAWSFADPDGKLASVLAKRLGAPAPLSIAVQAELGDTGAAAALLGLAPALAEAGVVGATGYGGGRATAIAVEVDHPVPGADGSMARLEKGRKVTYIEAARSRGLIEAMTDPVPMGLPPGGAAFVRGNPEMLGLFGARCRTCSTISTPPTVHPTCIGCGGDDLEVVPSRGAGPCRPSSSTRRCRPHSSRRYLFSSWISTTGRALWCREPLTMLRASRSVTGSGSRSGATRSSAAFLSTGSKL